MSITATGYCVASARSLVAATGPADSLAPCRPYSGPMADVRPVTGLGENLETTDPRHTFLTAQEVIARYGWGRTKGYQVLRRENFPRPVAGDRYRLDTLMAWEDSQVQERQRSAEHTSTPFPMRKRHRGGATPT